MDLDDLPTVLDIDERSFPAPWPARSYRYELMENPVAELLVAERRRGLAREIVGYIGMWELVDEGHISTLAVHPDHRRQGIGRELLEAALDLLRARGMEKVSLEVRESNRAAQELYGQYGFQRVGRRRGYYRDSDEDALVMLLEGLSERIEVGGSR